MKNLERYGTVLKDYTGRESGPPHSVCRFPGQQAGSFTPRGETLLPFPPRSENIIEPARGQEGRRGVGGWVRTSCEDRQNTNCIKQTTQNEQGFCPWSPPRGGARIDRAPGPAVQGRSARGPSPALPQHLVLPARCSSDWNCSLTQQHQKLSSPENTS